MKSSAKPGADLQLAMSLHQQGKLMRAEKEYRKYLALRPRDADALTMLGVLKAQTGHTVAAVRLMGEAVEIAPQSAPAHYNLARALQEQGRPKQAIVHLTRAAELAPGRADTHHGLGNALAALDRHEEAVAEYRRALAIDPRCVGASFNLGRSLRRLYREDEAVRAFLDAARLDPDDVETHYHLGVALYANRQYGDAVKAFHHVVTVRPDHLAATSRLTYAKRQTADWTGLADLDRVVLAAVHRRDRSGPDIPIVPYSVLASSDDPAAILATTARAATRPSTEATPAPSFEVALASSERIRVAYLGGDYREHATSYLIADVIESHDRARFEVVGVSFGPPEDTPMARRMRAAFDVFLDVRPYSTAVTAELLRQRGVHVAVDLVGFNQYARMGIFADRAAPIQVGYLGWPATTGAPYMDYFVADPIVVPAADRRHFAEAVVTLPECYQPNDRRKPIATDVPSRAACGLPDDAVVYCCFNNTFKIGPAMFDVWMRILDAVPGSVLWLLQDLTATSDNLRREMAARGVAPERLVLAPRTDQITHLTRHRNADIFLDTLPYNAHTTASDALWSEVPVVTCPGRSFQSRVAASLVSAVGLPELAVPTMADYERLAIDLGRDRAHLARMKAHLASARTTAPLFDAPRTARHLEAAYAEMVTRWRSGQRPSAFEVALQV